MGVFDEIDVKIKGQVKPEGTGELVVAKLNVICAEYGLELIGGSYFCGIDKEETNENTKKD